MAVINGTEDDDILGGSGGDTVNGLGGNDIITSHNSKWNIFSSDEKPSDFAEGGAVIYGDDGDDTISGDGEYEAHGGYGNDTITSSWRGDSEDADKRYEGGAFYGDEGNDTIESTIGLLSGGDGNDHLLITGTIDYADGFDTSQVYGNDGDDVLISYEGYRLLGYYDTFDILDGGDGNDTIIAGTTAHIFGGTGDDNITGNNSQFINNYRPFAVEYQFFIVDATRVSSF